MHRTLAPALLLLVSILALAACAGAAPDPATQRSPGPDAIRLAAKDLRFSTDALTAPAGRPFEIAFDSQESAPHNVAIYADSSASTKVFASAPFSGPAAATYEVPALDPGTYFFRCDVHPDMRGQLEVR